MISSILGALSTIGHIIKTAASVIFKTAAVVGKTIGIVGAGERFVINAVGKGFMKLGLARASAVAVSVLKTAAVVGNEILIDKAISSAKGVPILGDVVATAGQAAKAAMVYQIV